MGAGGECLTFDQLALQAPLGQGTVLLRSPQKARTAQKYMGKAPGVPNSDTRPRIRSTGASSRWRVGAGSRAATRTKRQTALLAKSRRRSTRGRRSSIQAFTLEFGPRHSSRAL